MDLSNYSWTDDDLAVTPLEIIRRAADAQLSTEDGEAVVLELHRGLSPEEIDALAQELPCPLPSEIRELLQGVGGFEGGAAEFVDFTGRSCSFEYQPAFPQGLPIAADGFGNFWVVDLLPSSRTWGPIYFACHDPPIILYQSPDLAHFLDELFKCNTPPYQSLVDDVREDRLLDVWGSNPDVCSHASALASDDDALREFAQSLDPSFAIIDLRAGKIGSGFAWGRYGPDTNVRRFGAAPVFAYRKPPTPAKSRGFFARLLS